MIKQAKQIARGLWEANQELAEEIAHEIYELRDESLPKCIASCITCAINDADICRTCNAKAVGTSRYPLWESKEAVNA
jgi:recombinational DNA repair protein RecR